MDALGRTLAFAVFSIAVLIASAQAKDAPQEWHWIIVWPNAQTHWDVSQGIAKVEFKGNRFTATMDPGFVLAGSISGKHVTAAAKSIGTEMDSFTMHGDIQRVRTDPENRWGWDRISLNAPGGFYVGLNRRVRLDAAARK